MEILKEKAAYFLYRFLSGGNVFNICFISIYSALNTLLEYTYFYIFKKILLLVFKIAKTLQCSDNAIFHFWSFLQNLPILFFIFDFLCFFNQHKSVKRNLIKNEHLFAPVIHFLKWLMEVKLIPNWYGKTWIKKNRFET